MLLTHANTLRHRGEKQAHHFGDTKIKMILKTCSYLRKSLDFYVTHEMIVYAPPSKLKWKTQITPKFDFAKVEIKIEKRKMEMKNWVDHKRGNSERWAGLHRGSLEDVFSQSPLKAVSVELWISFWGDTEPRDSLGEKPLLIYSPFPMVLWLEVENLSHPSPALLPLPVQLDSSLF